MCRINELREVSRIGNTQYTLASEKLTHKALPKLIFAIYKITTQLGNYFIIIIFERSDYPNTN